MKKFLAAAMLIVLMLPAVGLAELPDISGLSKAELMELNSMICKQLDLKEDFEPFEVPVGHWTVGENLPAGTYCLTSSTGIFLTIEIKNSKGGYLYDEALKDEKELPYVELENGATVDISQNSVLFSPAKLPLFGPKR